VTATVLLKPKRALPFYARHPWVFAGAVQAVAGNPKDGDEVVVKSTTDHFIARGLFNSKSKILVRLYSWEDRPLDAEFFREKLRQALMLRHDVLGLNAGPSAAYRAVNSEADGLSGLIVDRYADCLVVQLTALATAVRKEMIADLLQELFQPRSIVLRTEKGIGKLEGAELADGVLRGPDPGEVVFDENGLKFAVNLSKGQKTGYYLDQRDNRRAAAEFARGKSMLDAFCYSGGFGLYAARAGAAAVECVDASEGALTLARRNAELNGLQQFTFTRADVFDHLRDLVAAKKKFGVVVLDPPKFARNRAALPDAMQGYRRLHKLAFKLLEPGGILVSCCCTGLVTMDDLADVLAQTATAEKRDCQLIAKRGPASDHPVSAACPEGGYLKCIIARVQ
jgi:23S rRNA (cytosine1962-C5)-methyltransferase